MRTIPPARVTIAAALFTMALSLLSPPQATSATSPDAVNGTPNYSITFVVRVAEKAPLTPEVEVRLHGADEIVSMTSLIAENRYRRFRGDGRITQIGSDVVWRPEALNAALHYEVVLPHERKPGVYDSYGRRDWFITRTADLFPRKRLEFGKPAKSFTTVRFDLPKGWTVVTAMPSVPDRNNEFRAAIQADARYEWPTGWLMYGRLVTYPIKARDVTITLVYPESFIRPSKNPDPERTARREKYLKWFNGKISQIDDIFGKVIPILSDFMPDYAREFLIVMGKDPMWKGGLSGEQSLYINRGVPNIASDRTSTLVHEYFHVSAGFEKDERDAEWFVEGLAEYFSLRLLHEAKFTDRRGIEEAIAKLKSNGVWGVNLTRTAREKAFYKNAPVVLFTLDEMIRTKTQGAKSLKDVVTQLSGQKKHVNTRKLRKFCEEAYGESLEAFFAAYVYGGKVPPYRDYLREVGE